MDIKLSVSKTKTYSHCKKQFKYSYVLKMPRKEEDYHIFGKFCHMALEEFHNKFINKQSIAYNDAMTESFKTALVKYKDKMTKEMKDECRVILSQYLKRVYEKPEILNQVIACEKGFELLLDDKILLNGSIDRVELDSDGVIKVSDYKTTKNKKYLKNDWFQLLTYAYVLLCEDPTIEKVRVSYILLRHNFEEITEEFNREQILLTKNKFEEYATNILNEKEYPANPGPLCGWCPFLDLCEEGKNKVSPQLKYGAVNWT